MLRLENTRLGLSRKDDGGIAMTPPSLFLTRGGVQVAHTHSIVDCITEYIPMQKIAS